MISSYQAVVSNAGRLTNLTTVDSTVKMVIMLQGLIIIILSLFSSASSYLPGRDGAPLFTPGKGSDTSPIGQYCIGKDQLESIKQQETNLVCDWIKLADPANQNSSVEETVADVEWTLVEEEVNVAKIFHHPEKQLVLMNKCDIDGKKVNFYTWKCHPYGSMFHNTLWRLSPSKYPSLAEQNQELKQENAPYFFDIYVRKDAEPDGQWMCQDDSLSFLGVNIALASSPLENERISVDGKNAFWHRNGDAQFLDIQSTTGDNPRKKIAEIKLGSETYYVYENFLLPFTPDQDSQLYLVNSNETLPQSQSDDPVEYDVFRIIYQIVPDGSSLQLGTFNPLPPKEPWYQVYLPESKPVIYLYPEKAMNIDVQILPKNGYITVSQPYYDPATGWLDVYAQPSGELTYQQTTYPSLYYETEVAGYKIPEEGVVLPIAEVEAYLMEMGQKMGLNKLETQEFVGYWVDRFKKDVTDPYLFITFIAPSHIEEIVKLKVSPQPDTLIQVRAYFKPLKAPLSVEPQEIILPPVRSGFIVSEWGGILDN